MEVNTNYESPLVLRRIRILNSKFSCGVGDLSDIKLSLKCSRNVERLESGDYRIMLTTLLDSETDEFSVFVECEGIFATQIETTTLIERNTIAIMFPYVRSYITSLTTQPGIEPLVLPALNINAMIDEQEIRDKN